MESLVGVLILAYSHADMLDRVIKFVLQQTYSLGQVVNADDDSDSSYRKGAIAKMSRYELCSGIKNIQHDCNHLEVFTANLAAKERNMWGVFPHKKILSYPFALALAL